VSSGLGSALLEDQNNSSSTQLQRQNHVFILASVDLFVIARTTEPSASPQITPTSHLQTRGKEGRKTHVVAFSHAFASPLLTANVSLTKGLPSTLLTVQYRIPASVLVPKISFAVSGVQYLSFFVTPRLLPTPMISVVQLPPEPFGAVVENELRGDGVGGGGRES
jgi:hypothetical protein